MHVEVLFCMFAFKTFINDVLKLRNLNTFSGFVKLFEDLSKLGFFNGLHFHRVIADFMIQLLVEIVDRLGTRGAKSSSFPKNLGTMDIEDPCETIKS